jgi:hypothetical protein
MFSKNNGNYWPAQPWPPSVRRQWRHLLPAAGAKMSVRLPGSSADFQPPGKNNLLLFAAGVNVLMKDE